MAHQKVDKTDGVSDSAEQGIRIPVIVISASDDAQVREQARELGAVAFFRKPINDQALLDAISWAIAPRR